MCGIGGIFAIGAVYGCHRTTAMRWIEAINHATAPPTALKSGELTPAEKDLMATHGSDSLSADFENRARNKLLLSALEEYQRILDDQHAYPSLGALLALARTQRLPLRLLRSAT